MLRRRRVRATEESEELHSEGEDEIQDKKLSHASVSASENEDLDVSDYESLEEEHFSSSDSEPEQKDPPDPKDAEKPDLDLKQVEQADVKEEVGQSNRLTETKRESGDGKEESDNEHTKLEIVDNKNAEDKENIIDKDPSFIPTKGRFFQHDNRGEESQAKGRFRERKADDRELRWTHDMFVMEEQMPKTRERLIEEYGFDLRTKPIDETNTPLRQYRSGSGRGRGNRGRREKPPNPQRDGNYPAKNYQNDYPTLKNQGTNVVHKTKSYWKSKENKQGDDIKEKQRFQDATTSKSDVARPSKNENVQIPKMEDNNSVNQEVKPNPTADKKTDGKFSDLLHVINQGPSNRTSSKQSSNTRTANSNTSSMNYQESHKPRRYSSLRQRSVNSPVDGQSTNRQHPKTQDSRYSNFVKPVHPNTTNTTFISSNSGPNNKTLQHQVIPESQTEAVLSNSMSPVMHSAVSAAQVSGINPYNTPEPQTSIAAPMDGSSMVSHPVSMPFNPMINPMAPMYYEAAAAYQRMMQMSHQMSQMNLEPLQHSHPPPVLPHQTSGSLPTEGQTVPSHISQMNPMIPPISQGSLGSVMRAPPPPANAPTYFSGPIGVNLGMPQQPFPYPPNLLGQQVGGVTYFNTPSPPAMPLTPNQQSSPRRPNAAIPIMAPTGFGFGQMEY